MGNSLYSRNRSLNELIVQICLSSTFILDTQHYFQKGLEREVSKRLSFLGPAYGLWLTAGWYLTQAVRRRHHLCRHS